MSAKLKLREDDGRVFGTAKSHGAVGTYGIKCKYCKLKSFVRKHGMVSIIKGKRIVKNGEIVKNGHIVQKQRWYCLSCDRTFTIQEDDE